MNTLNTQQLQVKKIYENAVLPTQGSQHSAGWDIYATENTNIQPKQKALIQTGISVAIPYGCYGRIAPRSGLAVKYMIDVGAGVIDSDYRGEIKVLLFNFNDQVFNINKGDRIAQLIIEKYALCTVVEVDQLQETDRGDGGFGSTGINKM